MKINLIDIYSFGGIKNLKIEPDKGLNVIYGDNENGKTTVMAFIKMMFYGSERGSSQISKNIRKKYTPWDGSQMAGSIEFEFSGKNWRIEREFKGSNSTDRVTLIDLDLGTRQSVSGDIGTEFFSLSASAFERSIFIGQFGYPESDAKAESELNSKLSNIALTGDETVSYETVKERLFKARTALMSKSGNAGIYDKKIKRTAELEERLKKAVATNEEYLSNCKNADLAEAEIEKMQSKANQLKAKISAEQDIRNAKKLENLLALKGQLDQINSSLTLSDGTLADESYLKKLKLCLNLAEPLRNKVKETENEISTLEKTISAYEDTSPEEKEKLSQELKAEIASLEKEKSELTSSIKSKENEQSDILLALADKSNLKKKFNPILLLLSAPCFVLAITLFLLLSSPVISLALALIGIIFIILGFCIRPEDKAATMALIKKRESLKEEILSLTAMEMVSSDRLSNARIKEQTVNASINSNISAIENQKKLLEEAFLRLKTAKQELEPKWSSFIEQLSKYKEVTNDEDINPVLEEISSKALEQKEIKNQINYILKDIGNISYEEAKRKLASVSEKTETEADFDKIRQEYEKLNERINEGRTLLASKRANMKAIVSASENPELLRQEIKKLREETKLQKDFCDSAQIALDILSASFAEVRKSFGSQLEKTASDIFSALTKGKYETMTVSKSMEITAEEKEKFGSREIDYLSSGTADQAYLSLRLALSELMSEEEKLPVFLDDSLAQYDDKRLETATEFLCDYLKDSQGILFTCHKAVCDLSEKNGAKLLNL